MGAKEGGKGKRRVLELLPFSAHRSLGTAQVALDGTVQWKEKRASNMLMVNGGETEGKKGFFLVSGANTFFLVFLCAVHQGSCIKKEYAKAIPSMEKMSFYLTHVRVEL